MKAGCRKASRDQLNPTERIAEDSGRPRQLATKDAVFASAAIEGGSVRGIKCGQSSNRIRTLGINERHRRPSPDASGFRHGQVTGDVRANGGSAGTFDMHTSSNRLQILKDRNDLRQRKIGWIIYLVIRLGYDFQLCENACQSPGPRICAPTANGTYL
ncbi:hypothetical protein [Mesorhizobium sp. CO1-1-8]|uniref:hypothetical protein n=1 Tax=Mesorhizobium sp. CO1-1-8 TaxID=2876631 RepID=UPI001CD063F0|nr:hypothetical protein [Mesorhizobium sp. CO1-1-8]MBZ9775041.1 hypothetical protein [Mesorhizobium sp. CO1-1-8]